MIRESVLEAAVEDFLLREYGQDQIERRVAVGKDYASELATTERSLADLEEQYLANNLTAERFANVATKLEGPITELRALAQKATEEQWEKPGNRSRPLAAFRYGGATGHVATPRHPLVRVPRVLDQGPRLVLPS